MARTTPNPEALEQGVNGTHFSGGATLQIADALGEAPEDKGQFPNMEIWNDHRNGQGLSSSAAGIASANELEPLQEENTQLRAAMAELEQRLAEAETLDTQALVKQLKECEDLLDEKSETIRALHRQLQEAPERPPAATPREEELLALSEELERERRQLKEDEQVLMQQMREMEVQMSRERAEMARQRSELQRLQNEIRHELELAARDGTLRERLAPLQRRHQEMSTGRRPTPAPEPSAPVTPTTPPAPAPGGAKQSGIFRRIFG